MVILLVTLRQTLEGEWSPGIGDPTFVGWFTVVAYVVAAGLCWHAWKLARGQRQTPILAAAWWILAVLMLALGVNKQLDLQSWLTVVGRDLALQQGWYEQRQRVQYHFIRAVMVGGTLALTIGAWVLRRHLRDLWLAGVGAVFIVVFVVVRASSFHHVDILLSATVGGARLNWLLELGGIAFIASGARRYARRVGRGGRQPAST